MSARRVLVDCAVLSLQDSCVYYPCCKCCFSRVDVEQQDATRCRCSKCGYSCRREQVDYRYRLSLKVARDTRLFGVTVFGTCLNPFFGIHASGLQRLVDETDGPVGASSRSTLLVNAVRDCFIGRHFIFGIKVTGTANELWSGGHVANGSCSRESVQFIASQMILPTAAGLTGCTVVSYYRVLLQKAEEHQLGSTATTNTSRPPAPTLLLNPLHSPDSTFNNNTLSASGFFSQSLQRSQLQDRSLTPTPPWQQSLGLITSSAEQDEDCGTQDSGGENSFAADYSKTPHHALKSFLDNHEFPEETTLSPLLCHNRLSFSTHSNLSIEKRFVNTPTLDPWFSPSESVKKCLPLSSNTKEFCCAQLAETFSSGSLAWDDLPFSESFSEFFCEKDRVTETERHQNVQNVKETARNNVGVGSQEEKMGPLSSRPLADVTNTSAPNNGGDRHDADSVYKNCKSRSTCLDECNQNNVEICSLSFENEDKLLEGDTYNCSSDLFSSSLVIDMNTTLGTHTETPRMSLLCNPDKRYLMTEKPNVLHSTPDQQKLKSNTRINKNNFITPVPQDLDFIPPSQSTPNIKLAVVSGSAAASRTCLTLGEFGSQLDGQDLSRSELHSKNPPLSKLNPVHSNHLPLYARESTKENVVWSTTSTRRSHTFTPKRRFWKPDKHQQYLLAQQCSRARREALNLGSKERINNKCDSSVHDVTVCDDEHNEVPPTPAVKIRQSVKLRRRRLTNSSRSDFDSTCDGQKRVNCKRTPTVTSLQRHMAQTENCNSEVVDGGSLDQLDGYPLDDENQACDWSRDLFSDSL